MEEKLLAVFCARQEVRRIEDLTERERGVFQAQLRFLKDPSQRLMLQCAGCEYAVNEDQSYGGYCCKQCHFFNVRNGLTKKKKPLDQHGKRCKRCKCETVLRALPMPPVELQDNLSAHEVTGYIESLACYTGENKSQNQSPGSIACPTTEAETKFQGHKCDTVPQGLQLQPVSGSVKVETMQDRQWEDLKRWQDSVFWLGEDLRLCIAYSEELKDWFAGARSLGQKLFVDSRFDDFTLTELEDLPAHMKSMATTPCYWMACKGFSDLEQTYEAVGFASKKENRIRAALLAACVSRMLHETAQSMDSMDPGWQLLLEVAHQKKPKMLEPEPEPEDEYEEILEEAEDFETELSTELEQEYENDRANGFAVFDDLGASDQVKQAPAMEKLSPKRFKVMEPKAKMKPQMSFSVRSVPKMQHRVEPDIADKFKKNPSNSKYVIEHAEVDEIKFSQESIGQNFRNGRRMDGLIQDLLRGHVHPLKTKSLQIECFKNSDGVYEALNNRRLWCFKKFKVKKRKTDPEYQLNCKLKVLQIDPEIRANLGPLLERLQAEPWPYRRVQENAINKLLRHKDRMDPIEEVRVRQGRNKRRRCVY